jgi:hypothetical protein
MLSRLHSLFQYHHTINRWQLGLMLSVINLLGSLILSGESAFAQIGEDQGPRLVVQSIAGDLQREKNPAVILNYVHWPSAFSSLKAEERTRLKITSPEGMKNYFEGFFRDPGEFLKKELTERLEAMPQEKRASYAERFDHSVALMKKKQSEMKQRLASTSYSTGRVSVDGENARVELVSTVQGETRRELIPLVKVNGRWYLPSPSALVGRVSGGMR